MPVGYRETTLLLCNALLRAAGLHWYEQRDAWVQVSGLRPVPSLLTPQRATQLASAMRRLMTADARPLCHEGGRSPAMTGGSSPSSRPGSPWRTWLTAGTCAAASEPSSATTSSSTPTAPASSSPSKRPSLYWGRVTSLILPAARRSGAKPVPQARVGTVTAVIDSVLSAQELRSQLTGRLRASNLIRTPAGWAAIRGTPRHLFLPGIPLEQAYADNPVYTTQDSAGVNIKRRLTADDHLHDARTSRPATGQSWRSEQAPDITRRSPYSDQSAIGTG